MDAGNGYFDTFRTLPFPTLYGSFKTSVTADVLEAGFLFAIAILAFSFLVVLPGVILKKRLIFLLKIVIGLFILASIFLCNFGQEWEVAELETITQYKAGVSQEIHADIGVKIGLRSVNITLRAHDENSTTVSFGNQNETINYNERFSWDDPGWTLGRAGFGPNAGRMNREFRAAQFKGLPYPILWIAEYFTPDGEGIRWGRFYLQAGYFTHILLWTAFPLYLLSVILVMMVRSYGAVFFILTGASMITGNLCFAFIRNPTQLAIPFEDGKLQFHWGWSFWLCLFTGLLNLFLGFLIFILDFLCPDWLCEFLNVDRTQNFEEFYLSSEDLESLGIAVDDDGKKRPNGNGRFQKNQNSMHFGYRKKRNTIEQLARTLSRRPGHEQYRMTRNHPDFPDEPPPSYGRGDKERAPLPESYSGRRPVVPAAQPTQQTYTNPQLDEMMNDEEDYDDTMVNKDGLNMDPMKPEMDNYDNAKLKGQEFRSGNNRESKSSLDPLYDNTAVPTTPGDRKAPITPSPSILKKNTVPVEKQNGNGHAPNGHLLELNGTGPKEDNPTSVRFSDVEIEIENSTSL